MTLTLLVVICALFLNAVALLASALCADAGRHPEGAGVIMFGTAAIINMIAGLCWVFVGYRLAGTW